MNRPAFIKLLESVITGQQIWIDVVPEDEEYPALTYTHVAGDGTRLLSGDKVNLWDTWRVRIIGKTRAECDAIVELLKPLDNSRNNEYRRVMIQSSQGVPSTPNDEYVSSFIDFKTYD
tara:strand:- start:34311 stop:34664 length:354 start_codon:yes stop_codon:yes gene_type:complete